jgi:hypothetical protein
MIYQHSRADELSGIGHSMLTFKSIEARKRLNLQLVEMRLETRAAAALGSWSTDSSMLMALFIAELFCRKI